MNFDTLYDASRKIAGDMGEDLLHHVLEKNNFFQDKQVNNIDGYIFTVLRNEYRNQKSSFNQLYKQKEIEMIDFEPSKYDVQRLFSILIELEIEGYSDCVFIFKQCYFASNMRSVSSKSKISYRVIKKICNFVTDEIKKRYD